MFIAHSEASVQKIHISQDYKIPMCVLNIRYVLVISGNHLISCHTNTSASPHMPANNRHEQLYRSYKISGIDLSRRLIHYSTEPCTCMAVWNERESIHFWIFTVLDRIFSNYPKIKNPGGRRWAEIQKPF